MKVMQAVLRQWPYVLYALRCFASAVGFFVSFIGWSWFAIRVLFVGVNALDGRLDPGAGPPLHDIGYFLVAGWLLLRFANGLFPFGKRAFQ